MTRSEKLLNVIGRYPQFSKEILLLLVLIAKFVYTFLKPRMNCGIYMLIVCWLTLAILSKLNSSTLFNLNLFWK